MLGRPGDGQLCPPPHLLDSSSPPPPRNQCRPPVRPESSPAARTPSAAPSAPTSSPDPSLRTLTHSRDPMRPDVPLGLLRPLRPRAPASSQSRFSPRSPVPQTLSGPDLPTSGASGDGPGAAGRPPAAERQSLPGAGAAPSTRQFRVCGGRVPLRPAEGGKAEGGRGPYHSPRGGTGRHQAER